MPGLSTDLVVHIFPTDPAFPPVQQKLRKFKIDMSVKIKEEITKQLDAKLLKKNVAVKWNDKCQEAFDKIKSYLSNPLVLVPPEPGRPLILYLTVVDNSFGCVLGQHDITGKKEQEIYYLSKKFAPYEVMYTLLERTCCALTWVAQKLKHYLPSYTTYLISRMDPLKYIFQKPMPTGRLAKWQILLTEFDIIYVTQTEMKAEALVDHLAENLVDEEYEPLKTYFPDEEVMYIDEVDHDEKPGWKLFFDGAANMKGVGIGAVLISETMHHYPVTAQLQFYCTNNMAEYEACILGLRLAIDMSVEFRHIPRIHNEIVDALTTLASMLHHPDKTYVDPLHIQIRDQHAYCNVVEEEPDGEPWFHDVKEYIKSGVYPVHATGDQKRIIRRMASRFFLSGGILYKRTPDLGLLRLLLAHHGMRLHQLRLQMSSMPGATPILLVYGTEEVIPAEVEIPSLRIVVEAEIDDDEWVKTRLEQLSLIDEKRLAAVCHGQLYQKRMARAYNKKGKEILFALPGIPHEESMFHRSSVLSFQDPPG
ncbi:uncharacterized protein [Nicotiana tomentosiformis]|uniref:uncharacterized protein n=1 Tax=Nicotiana tomentosiformis TaxID=4098 RepID=UPI00388C47FD